MVDIWFFFCIFELFVIICFHVAVKNYNRENTVVSFGNEDIDVTYWFKVVTPIFTFVFQIFVNKYCIL